MADVRVGARKASAIAPRRLTAIRHTPGSARDAAATKSAIARSYEMDLRLPDHHGDLQRAGRHHRHHRADRDHRPCEHLVSGVSGRTGAKWERVVADYARDIYALPWDRAPLRGTRDLLDIQGCLPAGFLVGCKGIRRGSSVGAKIRQAMCQCDRAL